MESDGCLLIDPPTDLEARRTVPTMQTSSATNPFAAGLSAQASPPAHRGSPQPHRCLTVAVSIR